MWMHGIAAGLCVHRLSDYTRLSLNALKIIPGVCVCVCVSCVVCVVCV